MKKKLKRKFVIVIPARFKSTRFPGKPLAEIKGLPMIYHVWKSVLKLHIKIIFLLQLMILELQKFVKSFQ